MVAHRRNDRLTDENGNRLLVEPMTGNALLGYASPKVACGLSRPYADARERKRHTEPTLSQVDNSIDMTQAYFNSEIGALNFKLRNVVGDDQATVTVGNLGGHGAWRLHGGDKQVANVTAVHIGRAVTEHVNEVHGGLRPSDISSSCTVYELPFDHSS